MKKSFLITALLTSFIASAANAEGMGVSVGVGTTGIGADVSFEVQKSLNVRVGANYLRYDYSANTSDVDYDLKLKLQTVSALVDWFPMDGGFRVSAGLYHNGNKFNAVGKPKNGSTYNINGRPYTLAQAGKIDGDISFRSAAPYLGIGWGNPVSAKGWGFMSDFGILFQGKPTSNLSSDCNPSDPAEALICARLKIDVAAENVKLQDDLKNFKYYPVARIAVSYKF